VLMFNSTSFAEGLIRRKVIYSGRHYNIVVSTETHIVVHATSAGQYPLHSKGFFYLIHAIATSPTSFTISATNSLSLLPATTFR